MEAMIAPKHGKKKREPLSSRVAGRVDEETKGRVVRIANETGLDESDLVRLALNKFLPVFEKPAKSKKPKPKSPKK